MNERPYWWPSERGWVTIAVFAFALMLLAMGWFEPSLWEVEVFKVITQAVILTGILNMIVAFHFAANKDERDNAAIRAENTGKAFEAIKAAATATAETPQPVEVVNPPSQPVPVAASDDALDAGELPESDKL